MKKPLLFTSIFLLTFSVATIAGPHSIWIDTNIALGKANRDGDDAIAIIMALQSDEVVVDGIGVEEDVEYGAKITGQLVQWFGKGKQVPIFKGAMNKGDGGKKTDAVEGLAAALRKHKLTIVGLGPITNVTNTILIYPELKDSIESVVLCMGRRPNMHFTPGNGNKSMSDYNFDTDPEAVEYLITKKVPVTLCGYEAASTIYFGKDEYTFLDRKDNEGSETLYKEFRNWGLGWKVRFGSTKGFIPFDAVTMAYVLNPSLIEVDKNIPVDVQSMENDSKSGNFGEEKTFLIVSKDIDPSNKVNYCYKAKADCKAYIIGLLKKAVQ